MWESPRAVHNSAQILKYRGNTIILADRRHCSYLLDGITLSLSLSSPLSSLHFSFPLLSSSFSSLPISRALSFFFLYLVSFSSFLSISLSSLITDRHTQNQLLDLQLVQHPDVEILTSEQGESCEHRCRRAQMECHPNDFEFLNRCDVLQQHFPCNGLHCTTPLLFTHSRSHTHTLSPLNTACTKRAVTDKANSKGGDTPGYVVDSNLPQYGKCILNLSDQPSLCAVANRHITRLCPCMSPS